jgi:hypothetical protein
MNARSCTISRACAVTPVEARVGTLVGEPTFAPRGILRISFVGWIGHVQSRG